MADKKNLCAQIDITLHNRVTEEKDRLEMTTSQYIAALLTEYYKMKDENGGINMTGSRTMAFQIPEELFQRIKTHLARETARTGVKLTQRDFVLGLIEQALAEAEASLFKLGIRSLEIYNMVYIFHVFQHFICTMLNLVFQFVLCQRNHLIKTDPTSI